MRLTIIVSTIFLFSGISHAACTQYCKPGISYACGQGCISIYKHCRQATTTACNGNRPLSATKWYKTPKKVEPKAVNASQESDTNENTDQ